MVLTPKSIELTATTDISDQNSTNPSTSAEDDTDQLMDKLFSDEALNETSGIGVAAVNAMSKEECVKMKW